MKGSYGMQAIARLSYSVENYHQKILSCIDQLADKDLQRVASLLVRSSDPILKEWVFHLQVGIMIAGYLSSMEMMILSTLRSAKRACRKCRSESFLLELNDTTYLERRYVCYCSQKSSPDTPIPSPIQE